MGPKEKELSVADLLAPGRTPGPPVDVTERYRTPGDVTDEIVTLSD